MTKPKRCIARLRGGHSRCYSRAKYGDHCGLHSQERKAERAVKRGPTQFERDLAKRQREKERLGALLEVVREISITSEALRNALEKYDSSAD